MASGNGEDLKAQARDNALAAFDTANRMVAGTDTDFTHQTAADPSGNAIGPFPVGKTVKLRTRVTNANGATTGSVRTLVIAAVN